MLGILPVLPEMGTFDVPTHGEEEQEEEKEKFFLRESKGF